MFAREIQFVDDFDSLLTDSDRIQALRRDLQAGDVIICRQVVAADWLVRVRDYATQIGRHSLPNYHRIEQACPNFHRMNRWDPRAHVQGCFHQWSFFKWNQDPLDLFQRLERIYWLKNLLSDLPRDAFLGLDPEKDCAARLSIQFYPRGGGGLKRHQDPVDYHQLTVPLLMISQLGKDFHEGGGYVVDTDQQFVDIDSLANPGDVIFFNAQCPHGVRAIDEQQEMDWLAFEGRWVLIFAVNKLAQNQSISDSLQHPE